MKTINLFIVFLLVLEICVARKDINFLRLANCPEYKNYTVVLQNVVFTRNNKGKAVSVRFGVLFKKVVKRLMVLVTLKKCDNSGNLDSCEYFMNDFKINNACDIMGEKHQIWTQILSNSNFPRSCPISAGKYFLNDTKLENSMHISLIPIPIALWKIRFFTYDSQSGNVMVTCADLELKVFDERKH